MTTERQALFLAEMIVTARTHQAGGYGPHGAAWEALKEAHAVASQREYFAMVDALGGEDAVVAHLAAHLHP